MNLNTVAVAQASSHVDYLEVPGQWGHSNSALTAGKIIGPGFCISTYMLSVSESDAKFKRL